MAASDKQSFVFYQTFADAIEEISDEEVKNETYRAVIVYGLTGEKVDLKSEISRALFTAFATQIDAQKRKRKPKKSTQSDNKNAQKSAQKDANCAQKSAQNAPPNNNSNNNSECNNTRNSSTSEKQKTKTQQSKKKNTHTSKKAFGEFKNVFLTTDQRSNLRFQFHGSDEDRIEYLSAYKKSHPSFKSTDDYATIKTWALGDAKKARAQEEQRAREKIAADPDHADTVKREKMMDESLEADQEALWAWGEAEGLMDEKGGEGDSAKEA